MAKEHEEQEQYQESSGGSRVAGLLEGLVDHDILTDLVKIEKRVANNEPEKKEASEKKAPVKKETVVHEHEESEEDNDQDAEGQEEFLEDGKKNPDFKKSENKKEKKEIEIADNKFGVKIKPKEKEKATLDIESFDELPKVLKQKYGQDIKDVKGMTKFFETADKWRSDSQNLEKITKEKDNAIAVFENLPADLLEDVKAHYRGEDYREAREKTPKLDFSKPAEKQDLKKLVNAYFPGEFKEEDFDSDEKSKELAIAEKASIKQYNTDKATREQRATQEIEKAATRTKAYKASVNSSVEALKKDFPDMTADVISDIKETLSSGSLVSIFFNNDGTAKPNSAKMLALAQHGEYFIGQLMEIARRQGESEANEEVVERGNTKRKPGNGKGQEGVRKEVEDRIEDLIPRAVVGKRTF